MKLLKTLTLSLIVATSLLSSDVFANNYTNGDSVNVMVEASLFFEAYKNKQYEMWTIEKGLNVINAKPDFMPKLEIYKKIDKVISEVYADSNSTDELKTALADTAIYLYNKAIEFDKEDAGYFMLKKAYTLDQWKHVQPEVAIAAYEEGFAADTSFTSEKIYYADQLGTLYKNNSNDDNDYQIKALEMYSKLSDLEPENG
ncbi:MAG: hypothetical protein KDC67_13510, partial [Ignavibacteriae bacterium]|nr:hypothetical protein [Ignavibacteriota bacterium]